MSGPVTRYPFGYGQSYTRFAYGHLVWAAQQVAIADGKIALSFELANTGERDGVAVPQLYVRDRLATFVRPVKEVKAFCRVSLRAGEVATVVFTVAVDMLCFTGATGKRIVERG